MWLQHLSIYSIVYVPEALSGRPAGFGSQIWYVYSVHDGVINLAISRTHSSKFAEFTVKNQLYGQIKEALSTLSVVGRIFCDDLCEDLSQALESSDTSGSFSLRRIEAQAASKRAGLEELVWA